MLKNKIVVGLISCLLFLVFAEGFAGPKCATGISVSPAGPFTYCNGATSTVLTATTATSPGSAPTLTYVWFSNTLNSTTGGTQVQTTVNSSSTTDAFTPPTTSPGTLYYYCVVTNTGTCGSSSFTSATVQVTVNDLPVAPTGTGGSRCGTGMVNISATPGTGETIDWYAATSGGTALLSGSTTFTTPSISTTTTYYAEARNTTTGCVSSTRTAVVATVNAVPSAPTGTGSSRCGTGTVTISATPGTNETIDWYAAASGGSALLSGSTSFTTPSISTTTTYYSEARSTVCGAVSPSRTAVTATVGAVPTLSSVSQAATVCAGTNATINLTGLLASTTQTVSYNINSGSTQTASVTSDGLGAGNFTVAVTSANNGQTLAVTGISTGAGTGCSPTFSSGNSITLAVSYVTITSQPSTTNQSYCNNSTATPLSVSVMVGSGIISSYSWYSNSTPSNSGGTFIVTHTTSATTDSYTPLTSTNGTLYYYCVVNNSNSCSTTTNVSGKIAVSNGTSITTQPSTATQTICHGGASPTLTVAASASPSYQWYRNTTNSNSGGTLISGATSSSYIVPTTTDGTFYYYCVATKSGCTATSNVSGAITINPTSVAGSISGAAPVCAGTNSTLLTLSGNTGTIQWQSSPNNITFSNISGATSSTYTATNLSSTTYYRAVVTSGVCSSVATSSVTITVNPTSVAGSISGAGSVCTGTNSTMLTLSGNTGTIQWQSSPDNAVFSDIGGATSSTYTANDLSSTTYYRAVVTSGVCTSSTTASVTINVNPTSVAGSISGGGGTVCGGSNNTTLTLSGNTGTIQWQSSPDNFSYTDISGETSSTYVATNLSSATYYLAVVTSGACAPVATASVVINVTPTGTTVWTGSSTSWSSAGNWSCGLPTGSLNVSIPAGLANYPIIASGTTVAAQNLTISANATLTLTDNTSVLQIAGDFTNNGTLTSNGGAVEFNGTIDQFISGTPATTFDNVNITNGSGVVYVESDQNLKGVLTLSTNSTFDADGSSNASVFTILSTGDLPTADASIATLPSGASVTGNVTVQRYMGRSGSATYNYNVHRDISSPVTSTVSDLQNFLPVTGPFSNSSTVTTDGSTTDGTVNHTIPSLVSYDETVTGSFNNGWNGFPASGGDATTATFTIGKGYSLFIFGSDYPVLQNNNAAWSLTGPVNSGSISLPITLTKTGTGGTYNSSTDGWNLVGNPYPSTIDWSSAQGWTKININNAIYIDNYSTGTDVFSSYVNGVSTNGGSRYIAMGQGFWIKANAVSPVLSLDERVKVGGQQTSFFRASAPNNLIRVTLSENEVLRDETVIYFADGATDNFDNELDAYKLPNRSPAFNISSRSNNNENYAINSLPLTDGTKSISLDVSDITSGFYNLNFSDYESMPPAMNILLRDSFTNTITDIRQNQNYSFNVDQNNSSTYGFGRFSILFSSGEGATASMVAAFPNPVNGILTIEAPGENSAHGQIYNSLGLSLNSIEFTNEGSKQSARVDFGKQTSGIYFVKVEQGDHVAIIRIVKD